jgi:probable DNA metabolism protein
MINYIYDGTFEGLLTVIAGAIDHPGEVNDISAGEAEQLDLFTEIKSMETDPVLAAGFFKKLSGKFSRSVIMDIGYCFLSEVPGIEKAVLDYIRLLLDAGEKAAHNFSDGTVFKIERVSTKVNHEIHRLHGFVRFRKLRGGMYYAAIEPDYNIVQYLAPHFKARFADQEWLIHDVKRKTGIYYNGNRCLFLPEVEMSPLITSESRPFSLQQDQSRFDPEEAKYQKLWDQYFREIAITERRNKRLQRQRMPARYWRYLVEDVEG